jgi:hypothetical protein
VISRPNADDDNSQVAIDKCQAAQEFKKITPRDDPAELKKPRKNKRLSRQPQSLACLKGDGVHGIVPPVIPDRRAEPRAALRLVGAN